MELVDQVAPVGEDQHPARLGCLDEPERRYGLARAGRVLEPESLGGVGVLWLLAEVLLIVVLIDPVARLLVRVRLLLGLILGLVVLVLVLELVLIVLVLVGCSALDGTELVVVLILLVVVLVLVVIVVIVVIGLALLSAGGRRAVGRSAVFGTEDVGRREQLG